MNSEQKIIAFLLSTGVSVALALGAAAVTEARGLERRVDMLERQTSMIGVYLKAICAGVDACPEDVDVADR